MPPPTAIPDALSSFRPQISESGPSFRWRPRTASDRNDLSGCFAIVAVAVLLIAVGNLLGLLLLQVADLVLFPLAAGFWVVRAIRENRDRELEVVVALEDGALSIRHMRGDAVVREKSVALTALLMARAEGTDLAPELRLVLVDGDLVIPAHTQFPESVAALASHLTELARATPPDRSR